jgi:hypothetical protein
MSTNALGRGRAYICLSILHFRLTMRRLAARHDAHQIVNDGRHVNSGKVKLMITTSVVNVDGARVAYRLQGAVPLWCW